MALQPQQFVYKMSLAWVENVAILFFTYCFCIWPTFLFINNVKVYVRVSCSFEYWQVSMLQSHSMNNTAHTDTLRHSVFLCEWVYLDVSESWTITDIKKLHHLSKGHYSAGILFFWPPSHTHTHTQTPPPQSLTGVTFSYAGSSHSHPKTIGMV